MLSARHLLCHLGPATVLQPSGHMFTAVFWQAAAAALLTHNQQRLTLMLCCAACVSFFATADRVDLSNCELSQLPPELFELTNLLELSLAGNQLTQLPPELGRLSCLQRLVLAGNWLEQLPQVRPVACQQQCCLLPRSAAQRCCRDTIVVELSTTLHSIGK